MRVVTVIAMLLVGGAATLEAQHHFQFEVGGFAAYTRFDRAFELDNQIGGGGRIGFWITDWLGIEGDGLYQRPHSKYGGANFPVWFASGSIVLNFGSEKSFYILGGYSAGRERKAWLLDVLSHDFRERAFERGIRTNPAFAGAYEFREDADIAALFAGFLDGLPDGGLIMCHPGFVDADLQRLDPLTTLREREYAFLASERFPGLLAAHGVKLA